jgi:hypothetical protein
MKQKINLAIAMVVLESATAPGLPVSYWGWPQIQATSTMNRFWSKSLVALAASGLFATERSDLPNRFSDDLVVQAGSRRVQCDQRRPL